MSRIRTNLITNRMANGAPTVSNGLVISGITTTSEILVGNTIKLDPVAGIVTAPAVDVDDFLDVGSNIKLGNAGVITATSFVGSGANLTGITIPGGAIALSLNDSVNINVGGSNDLQLSHDSNDSYITSGTGNFVIQHTNNSGDLIMKANDFYLRSNTNENYFRGQVDGAVELYHNNVKTLETTGSGIIVSGIGTFGGGITVGYDTTYSPIQQSANTWWYTRLDQIASYQSSNLQNLATSSIKISDVIPIHNMTRQSDAGAHTIYNSSTTSGQVKTNMSAANPFHPKAFGLTMGTMFYSHTSGNNGSGVIHYGGNATNEHFFVRYKYSSVSLNIGADTDGSDVWTTMYQNDLMSDSNWYFLVIAVERNGTLLTSLNGAPLTPIRMLGTAPSPSDAFFGLAGDPYGDNNSRHRYATAFWYKGIMSNELIAQEYAWLKTIWTGASLP